MDLGYRKFRRGFEIFEARVSASFTSVNIEARATSGPILARSCRKPGSERRGRLTVYVECHRDGVPDPKHQIIGELPKVFILISGDDDLTEAVAEAQVHGVQVILLAVANTENKPHGMSRHLIRAADGLEILPPETIAQTVTKAETPR